MWWITFSLAIPQILSLFAGWMILSSINLPNNAFRRIIYILCITDICLALIAFPLTLSVDAFLLERLYIVSRILFDASFFLSFCLALIAFTIVKLEGTVESIPAIFIICACLLSGLLHAVVFEFVHRSESPAWLWLNFANATIYTFGIICIVFLYISTYKQLRKEICTASHASSLMTQLIMAFTITNVFLWLPIVLCNWLFLDASPVPSGAPHILYLISLSSRGLFHALPLLLVLGYRSTTSRLYLFGKLTSVEKQESTLPLAIGSRPLPAYTLHKQIDKSQITTILESLHY